MYNDEYDNEQDVKNSDNFIVNFYYNNKILIWILIGVIAFILIMSLLTKGGSSSSTKNSYDVRIIPEEAVEISIGNSYTLRAKVNNNANAIVVWSSENENIAKVDNGTVTAVGYGKTRIKAEYIHSSSEKYEDFKEVVVADGNPNLKLTDVSFKNGDLLMPLNSTYRISLSLTPSNGYITNKVFTSSNERVITVDSNGLVTSVGEGEATVTLNVNDGTFRKDLRVFVSRDYVRSEIIINPEKINFDGELRKMKIGSSEKLKYTLFPIDADASKLVWTSSNEEVARVDQNGIVRALKAGRATITLKSVTGVNDSIDIEVEESIVEVTDISLSLSNLYLNVNQSETITPIVSPADASNKSLSFISGDSSIVAVYPNQTGTVATIYAIRAGTTVITVSSNNNIEKRLSVTVTDSGSSGGSSGGDSGGSSSTTGIKVTSRDANGEPFVVDNYSGTTNNAATAPVTITVSKTDSSIAKVRVAMCLYPASSCDPSSSINLKSEFVGSSASFTMTTQGVYLIRVGKYNSSGALIGTVDKYIAIGNTSGSDSQKHMSMLTYYCSNGNISSVKDGTKTLTSSEYSCSTLSTCTSGYKCYRCTGSGNYIGYYDYKCSTSGSSSCVAPTSLSITPQGKVTWIDNGNNTTKYQIKIGSSNWADVYKNGGEYLTEITKTTGSRTVSVRSVCGSTTSNAVSKSVNVYTVKLTAGTGISNVHGYGNYISGCSVTIWADVRSGYTWQYWQSNNTRKMYTDNKMTLIVDANADLTANAMSPAG